MPFAHPRRIGGLVASAAVLVLTAACRDDGPLAPSATAMPAHAAHAAHLAHSPGAVASGASASDAAPSVMVRAMHAVRDGVAAFVGNFLSTPLGTQPIVTPSMRIVTPRDYMIVRRNQPVFIRVRYRDFDMRPDLRTPNAAATLGSEPQVVTDGYVQGHVHGYLQRLTLDGELPDVNATSFCVLERVVERSGYEGVVEGECPAVERGLYRLSTEFQTNSHTAILKDGPRAVPTSDVLLVWVR